MSQVSILFSYPLKSETFLHFFLCSNFTISTVFYLISREDSDFFYVNLQTFNFSQLTVNKKTVEILVEKMGLS